MRLRPVEKSALLRRIAQRIGLFADEVDGAGNEESLLLRLQTNEGRAALRRLAQGALMGALTPGTSARHSEILDGYKSGTSRLNKWAEEKLGVFRLTHWEWGRLSMTWEIDDRFVMPDGVMFGGHVASVADHVAGLAAMTVLEANDDRFRTSRLETNFFRPVMKPKASIEARVVNASKSLIHVEADFLNAEGKLAARVSAVQMKRTA